MRRAADGPVAAWRALTLLTAVDKVNSPLTLESSGLAHPENPKMDPALLHQLGELLLNSVPTIIIFLIVWVAYEFLVDKPLGRVLGQRHEMTMGAITRAQADVALAEARSRELEEKLRQARMEVFRQQEARRKQGMDARGKAVAEARSHSEQQVRAARTDIEKETAVAKQALDAQGESLANEVIRAILKPAERAEAGSR